MKLREAPSRLGRAPTRMRAAPKLTDNFYLTAEWRSLAEQTKRRAGYSCESPDHEGPRDTPRRDLIADHIVERRDGGADLDISNTWCLCTACHNRKTALARAARNGATSARR